MSKRERIMQSVSDFANALAKLPKFVGVLNLSVEKPPKFVGVSDLSIEETHDESEFDFGWPSNSEGQLIGHILRTTTHQLIRMSELDMKVGNLQQSIHVTANSVIFMVYLSDVWMLFVEYYINHVESIQSTLDDVISKNQMIFGTIYS